MPSQFVVSIVDRESHTQALLVPGGVAERDLVQGVVDALASRKVGVFRTQAQVTAAVREAMHEVLTATKGDVLPK